MTFQSLFTDVKAASIREHESRNEGMPGSIAASAVSWLLHLVKFAVVIIPAEEAEPEAFPGCESFHAHGFRKAGHFPAVFPKERVTDSFGPAPLKGKSPRYSPCR